MAATSVHPLEQAGGYWTCPGCGDLNLPDAGMCQRCGEEKPQRVERVAEQEGAAA